MNKDKNMRHQKNARSSVQDYGSNTNNHKSNGENIQTKQKNKKPSNSLGPRINKNNSKVKKNDKQLIREDKQCIKEKEYLRGRNSSKVPRSGQFFEKQYATKKMIETEIFSSSKGSHDSRFAIMLPKDEYLLLGDSIYPVGTVSCPTKRLLANYRSACLLDTTNSIKYIEQDRQSGKNSEERKKCNIFQQARREIQNKLQNRSAIKIQNWWKSLKVKFNPENLTGNQKEVSIEPKGPKKIEFEKQDDNEFGNYVLPRCQTISQENEKILTSYAAFRLAQSNQDSDDSSLFNSPLKFEAQENVKNDGPIITNLLKQFQEATIIKEAIEKRTNKQKNQSKLQEGKVGISTSLLNIHSFLLNFFNFYIYHYKQEFLGLINMPFGNSIKYRLKIHQNDMNSTDLQEDQNQEGIIYGLNTVIDDEKLEQYFQHVSSLNPHPNSVFRTNMQLQKIHSQAILDSFNEELNSYRPYKQINGVPYPWNYSDKALTFYFVSQENIAQVFEKAQLNVLKSSSMLCGLLIDHSRPKYANIAEMLEIYENSMHPILKQNNDAKQCKLIQEIAYLSFQPDIEIITKILIQVSDLIAESILIEAATESFYLML